MSYDSKNASDAKFGFLFRSLFAEMFSSHLRDIPGPLLEIEAAVKTAVETGYIV